MLWVLDPRRRSKVLRQYESVSRRGWDFNMTGKNENEGEEINPGKFIYSI